MVSTQLAECMGAIAGDGSITKYEKGYDYKVIICGNKTEDLDYFNYLSKLLYKQFGVLPRFVFRDDGLYLVFNRKKVFEQVINLGFVAGRKSKTISIQRFILNNMSLSLSFLRGLADTDFCITFKKKRNNYPVIQTNFASQLLVKNICSVLDEVGITYYYAVIDKKTNFGEFTHYRIEINGKENLKKWMHFIGFSNPRHLTKIAVWKKFGYCPPNTTIKERYKMLNIMG